MLIGRSALLAALFVGLLATAAYAEDRRQFLQQQQQRQQFLQQQRQQQQYLQQRQQHTQYWQQQQPWHRVGG
jgi:hypothetical protein